MKHTSFGAKVRLYYGLTKPGIIRGNIITAIAGFLLASDNDVDFSLFAGMIIGLALIIASACVFNNYLDQGIDAKMERTQRRALVNGTISNQAALWYAGLLGVTGSLVLAVFTNYLALISALVGLVAYVVLYGYAKRKTVYGTLVGSISGSTPPVIGYVAVSGQYDIATAVLFVTVAIWQMPHFYAIAMYRAKDYARAGLPVLPVVGGRRQAIRHIMGYILLFCLSAPLLTVFGYTGPAYAIAALLLGLGWLISSLPGAIKLYRDQSQPKPSDGFDVGTDKWAKQVFLVSLIVISAWCVLVSLS